MPAPPVTCRHCEKRFIPQHGKPGYRNECPECLYEKTRPKVQADFSQKFLARFPERLKAFAESRKVLASLGLSESDIDDILAEGLRRAGTP